MRRIATLLATLAITVSLVGVQPASATHGCTSPSCTPVSVAVLEGIGWVCSSAQGFTSPRCTYHNDQLTPLWSTNTTMAQADALQGLYCPSRGPGANGPFSFQAGPAAVDPPNSVCVSSVGGPGCTFTSKGTLAAGNPGGAVSGVGAYAGSSQGDGTSVFTAGPGVGGPQTTTAGFSWDQSAATILPLNGKVTSSNPPGGVGATVTGFTSSRGFSGHGNCGVDATTPTQGFQVEGMVVTF